LKYDFVIRPGGNPADIRISYNGSQRTSLDGTGRLSAVTPFGGITDDAPVTFQQSGAARETVASAFVVKDGVVSFQVGGYNKALPLVIDPLTTAWSTFYGASNLDRAYGAQVMANGDVVVTGITQSSDFPITVGQATPGGSTDIFIGRFTEAGALVWSTRIGGSGLDYGYDLAGDDNNNVYLTGYSTSSSLGFTTGFRTTQIGGGDIVLAQLSSTGTVNWGTFYGGTANDQGFGVDATPGGTTFLVGSTFSSDFNFGATNPFQATFGGGNRDVVLARFNSSGTPVWGTYVGGAGDDQGLSLDWIPGFVHITGSTTSANFPVSNAFDATQNGGTDVFVAQFDLNGAQNWGTYYGGSSNEQGNGVGTDEAGNVYVTGFTESTNLMFLTGGTAQGSLAGGRDIFVANFANNGQPGWNTYYGGANNEEGLGIAVSDAGDLLVTGFTRSSDFPVVNNTGIQAAGLSGSNDAVVLFLDELGQADVASYYGGSASDFGRAVATDGAGVFVMTGQTNSPNFPTLNAFDNAIGASDDAFIVRFDSEVPCPDIAINAFVVNVSCFGGADGSISLNPSAGEGPYTADWSDTFTGLVRTNLAAGVYTVTVTDANGCEVTQSINVTQSPQLFVSAFPTDASCSAFGSIAMQGSGGSGSYIFTLDGNAIVGSTVSGLAAGTYAVGVIDGLGCTTSTTVTIGLTGQLTLGGVSDDISCFGGNDGSIDLVVGGASSYNVAWSNGAQTEDLTGLTAGIYLATVTTATGCVAQLSFTIVEPAQLVADVVVDDVNCFGGSDGSIDVTVSGGVAPYSFSWAGGLFTSEDLTGLPAGVYTGVISDANGCTLSADVTVGQPAQLVADVVVTDVSCFGGSDGAIDVTVSGGVAPYSFSWNDGAFTSEDLSGLMAGDYSGTITDANGCTLSATITVGQPAPLNVEVVETDVTCFGACDGSIDLTVSGGVAPYSFTWSNGEVSEDLAQLCAGSYTGTVTDANGCSVSATFDITEPAEILADASFGDVTCFGGSNGFIDLTTSGGTGALSFAWTMNGVAFSTEDSLSNLMAGEYCLTITDSIGCFISGCFTIAEPAQLVADVVVTDVSCFGGSDGAIDVTVSGGVAPYTFSWGNEDLTGLIAGVYVGTITDANGCTLTDTITIGQPAELMASASVTDITCHGTLDGAIDLTVMGGTAPYAFSWDNNASTEDIAGLAAGDYIVVVTDAHNCTWTDTFTVVEPAIISVLADVTDESCFDSNNGSIELDITGGTAPFTVTWNDGFVGEDRTDLAAGQYCAIVADLNGCSVELCYNIDEPAEITGVAVVDDVNCFGGSDGAIDFEANGGVGGFSYEWSNGETTQDISGLTAGDYTVTVTDFSGCQDSWTITVLEPALLEATAVVDDVNCFGGSDGSIDVTVMGGVAPYSYLWNTGSVSEDTTGVAAGDYTLTVTDANGCTVTATWTVTEPTRITFSGLDIDDVSCFGGADGAIGINVSEGTPPYTFSWVGPNGFTASTEDISGLIAGEYTLTVTDANGCTRERPWTVNEPGLLSTDFEIDNALCYDSWDGAVRQTPIGGTAPYAFSWEGPNGFASTDQDLSGLEAGDYALTITDANGCTFFAVASVLEPADLDFTIVGNDASCNGNADGDLTVVVNGGGTAPYLYVWNTGDTGETLWNIPTGTYDVTVIDANGCLYFGSYDLGEGAPLAVSVDNVINVSCFGGSNGEIWVTAAGEQPVSFSWEGPNGFTSSNEDLTGLMAGTYYGTATAANGCEVEVEVAVWEPTALAIIGLTSENVSCFGANDGSIDITVDGGTAPYTFNWSNSATTEDISDLGPGDYTGTITDANGCTLSGTWTITEPTELTLDGMVFDAQCVSTQNTGSIDITVTGGTAPYTYAWVGPFGFTSTNEDLAGVGLGFYAVTVTDANGCQIFGAGVLEVVSTVYVNFSVDNNRCFGDANGHVVAEGMGGTAPYFYAWFDETTGDFMGFGPELSGLANGSYFVVVTDINGCFNVASVDVTSPADLDFTIVGEDVSCFGLSDGRVEAIINGGGTAPYIYIWNTGDVEPVLENVPAGTYDLFVVDGNQCVYFASYTVGQPDLLVATGETTNLTCFESNDGAIDATITGGTMPYTIMWTGPNGFSANTEDISGLAAGGYVLNVVDANGCARQSSFWLTQPDPIQITFSEIGKENCEEGVAGYLWIDAIGGTGSLEFAWSGPNGFASSDEDLNGIESGDYTVVITDDNGCTLTQTYTVEESVLALSVIVTDITCYNGSNGAIDLTVAGNVGALVYDWTGPNGFSAASEDIAGLSSGIYNVTVTDADGCFRLLSVELVNPPNLPVDITTEFVADDFELCQGEDLSIGVQAPPGNYTYQWYEYNFGTGDYDLLAGEINLTHLVETPNTVIGATYIRRFRVAVIQTDGFMCTYFSPDRDITIYPNPIAEIQGDNAVCIGETVTLTAVGINLDSQDGLTYQWYADGVMIDGATASTYVAGPFAVPTTINYSVNIAGPIGCNDTSDDFQVSTIDLPVASISYVTSLGNNCTNATFTFSATPNTGLNYQWSVDGVNVDGATAADFVNNFAPGTYTIGLWFEDQVTGCENSTSLDVTVDPRPVVTDITVTGNNPTCEGSIVTLTAVTDADPAVASYEWFHWDNGMWVSLGTTVVPTFDVTESGNYGVEVTTAAGCDTFYSEMLELFFFPEPRVVHQNPLQEGIEIIELNVEYSWCGDNYMVVEDSNGIGLEDLAIYEWQRAELETPTLFLPIDGGLSRDYTIFADGVYRLVVQYPSAGCVFTSNTITVSRRIAPVSEIVQDSLILCDGGLVTMQAANLTIGLEYQWYIMNEGGDPDNEDDYTAIGGQTGSTYSVGILVNGTPDYYRVGTINPDNGCEVLSDFAYVYGSALQLNYLVTAVSDCGATDGEINGTATTNGGGTPITVDLRDLADVLVASVVADPITGAFSFTGLAQGGYTLTGTDAYGCQTFGGATMTVGTPQITSIVAGGDPETEAVLTFTPAGTVAGREFQVLYFIDNPGPGEQDTTFTAWDPTNPLTISGLQNNTTYQFRVRLRCSPLDSTAWGAPVLYTTAPDAAACQQPGGLYVNVDRTTNTTADIYWNADDATANWHLQYRIVNCTDPFCDWIDVEINGDACLGPFAAAPGFAQLTNLFINTEYEARVSKICGGCAGGVESEWSVIYPFNTFTGDCGAGVAAAFTVDGTLGSVGYCGQVILDANDNPGNYTYRWQHSADDITWNNIPDVDAATKRCSPRTSIRSTPLRGARASIVLSSPKASAARTLRLPSSLTCVRLRSSSSTWTKIPARLPSKTLWATTSPTWTTAPAPTPARCKSSPSAASARLLTCTPSPARTVPGPPAVASWVWKLVPTAAGFLTPTAAWPSTT